VTESVKAYTIKTGTWTIKNTATGEHRTFRVTKIRPATAKFAPGRRLVEILSGPNNTRDYTAFAFAEEDSITVWSKHRGIGSACSPHDYYAAMLAGLLGGRQDPRAERDWAKAGYEIMGSSRCASCNGPLTNPTSIEIGIGPKCLERK